MSIEVVLPNIGEGVEEADIAQINVAVGDQIAVGQVLMELETEKAVVEMPSPKAGVVEKLVVKAGDTVRVGQPVLLLQGEGAAAKSAPAQDKPAEKKPAAEAAPPAEKKPEAPAKPAAGKPELVGAPLEFKLPPLGEGVNSADVAAINVAVGDVVTKGQVLMELETEKAVVELPSPQAGKITKILAKVGDSLSIGQQVVVLETTSAVGGEKPAAKPAPEQKAAPAAAPAEKKPAVEAAPARSVAVAEPVPRESAPAASANGNGLPVAASPSTRRLARQLGVNLQDVRGSGRGGRITHDDVQAFVRERLQMAQLPARAEARGGLSAAGGGGIAPPPLPDFSRFGKVEREKMNKIARTAAENLTVAWNVIPHVTHHDRVDITDLEAARKRFGGGLGKNGPKVTMTAIVMKALAKCLQAFPKFNSSLDPLTHEIVYKRYYNIGCAVDTPNGLLVPVVHECDRKSILDIAQALGDLAEKARDRKLPVDAMQGATCTVTNLGGIGGIAFTPIVNYPEVCILGMSRGQQELRLNDGKIEERLMLPLSLSYDHRVINGADAARFMVALSNLLSDPFQLLTTV